MIKLLRLIYLPYQWLIFTPLAIIFTLFFGFLAVILAFVSNAKIASLVGGVIWAKLIGCLTPIFVSVRGRENIKANQSYVIISNHQSFYDIFLIYGWLGIDAKWVMKQELRKIPGLGIGSEKIGHIFIDRSNSNAAISSINKAKKKIINGTSIIFFPEGTRKNNALELGAFKKGAFKLALDLKLPILPISIVGTRNILPPSSAKLFPGKVKLIIHPPIEIQEYNNENIDSLILKSREIIKNGIELNNSK